MSVAISQSCIFSDKYVIVPDCSEAYHLLGKNEPGPYYLSNTKLAYCDGEWTRILSRGDYGNIEVRFKHGTA